MTPDQRVFASYHPLANTRIRVIELKPNGKAIPYPNMNWQGKHGKSNQYFDAVLGLRSDKNGILWIMDMTTRENGTPKLIGWDTKTNSLYKIISFPPPLSNQYSVFNDIADEGWNNGGDGSTAALIAVDLKTGAARRLLEGDKSTKPENIDIHPNNGQPLVRILENGKKQRFRIGVDGIVVDKNDQWLYFAPVNGNKLYRIKTKYLVDPKIDNKTVSKHVELFSTEKPANGGLSMDIDGNIWTVDFTNFAIGYFDKKGNTMKLFAIRNN